MHRMRLFAMLLAALAMGAVPRVEAADVLSLDAAVLTALEQNPELKAMQQDAAAAKTKYPGSRFWEDPMIGVRFYDVPLGENIDKATDIDYIIAQKFPFPGKVKAASKAAYHEYLYTVQMLGARGREIVSEVKTAYYGLYAAQRMIEVNRKIESYLRSTVQVAQSKLAAGQAMGVDAVQGQAELAKILSDRESLNQERNILQAKLNRLMSRPSQEEIRLPAKLQLPQWEVGLEEMLALGQESHPAVKGAQEKIEEKNWAVKAAKREYYPDFGARWEYFQHPGERDAWTGELMLNIPLIVNKKKLGVSQAEAELAGATFSRQAVKNTVAYRVRETYEKMKSNDRILRLTTGTLLPQSRQAVDITSAAYTTGKASFLDFLNATRGLLEAEMNYWKAFEAMGMAISELEEAAGMTREEYLAAKGAGEPRTFDLEKTIGAEEKNGKK